MSTINDVSRLAGVSKATVSRVLSGSRGVKEASRQAVLKAVEELKNSGVECILCQDDYICDEVVRKLARMGVRIPDQMKVASCHYSRILENYPVTITSLKFNITELGRRSCQVLLDMIHGKTVPDKTLLDYEIILKESTKG